jgi:hypothetical protein
MRTLLLLVILAALAVPAAALGKGPDYATISGPGISGSIRIDGDGEGGGTGTPLGSLVVRGGFPSQVFGHHPNDPTTNNRPGGNLGPRYRVVYSVPTPAGRRSIVADLYPYTIPRAVTYMRPGQPFFQGMQTHGGWYVAKLGLKQSLLEAGLPDRATSGNGTSTWRWFGIGALAFSALAAAAALLLRRRPQSTPAPAS